MRKMKVLFVLALGIVILMMGFTSNVGAEGGKIRIAVLDFENKVPNGQADLGWGMADMLITALRETGRYTVLEREALADVLGEQDFAGSSRADNKTSIKKGKLLGAQLLIKGAITEFSYNTGGGNLGLGYKGFGLGTSSSTARAAADIRVVDAVTGEVIESHHDSVEAKSSGLQLSGSSNGFSFGVGGNKNSPLGKAARDLIEKMTNFIGTAISSHAIEGSAEPVLEGRVIKVDGPDMIYFNRGEDDGVKIGDKFDIYHPTESLVDPETGETLGSEKEFVGRVEVIKVDKKYSVVKSLSGESFVRNDIVQK